MPDLMRLPTDTLSDAPDAMGTPDVTDSAVDGGPDSGPDAGAPCGAALMCHDFELPGFLYDISLAKGSVSTVGLSTAQAHSGDQSVLVHAASGDEYTNFNLTPFDESRTGERWARAWFLLPTGRISSTPFSLVGMPTSLVTIQLAQTPSSRSSARPASWHLDDIAMSLERVGCD